MKKKILVVIIAAFAISSSVMAQNKLLRFGFMSANTQWGHKSITITWDSAAAINQPDTVQTAFFLKNMVLNDSLWLVVDPDTVSGAGGRNRKIEMDYKWVIDEPLLSVGAVTNTADIGTWVQLEDSMLYGGYASTK